MRLKIGAATSVGRVRPINEDAYVVRADQGLCVVCDGMGGAAAGEVASEIATKTVVSELDAKWRRSGIADPETFAVSIKAATETANTRIHKYAAEHPENRGMGTTATIAGILGDTLFLAQVGDSRGYLIRRGVAQQITKDQSLMQKLVEAGELTAEEAEVSDRRNIILQALEIGRAHV